LRYHRRSLSPHDDKKIAVSPSHIGAGQPDARNARHDFVKVRGHAMSPRQIRCKKSTSDCSWLLSVVVPTRVPYGEDHYDHVHRNQRKQRPKKYRVTHFPSLLF
jgi:hypothetical protein